MTLRNIALIGRARSGKDTVAARLVATRQYTRVAFADPLKEMALGIDPIVHIDAYEDEVYEDKRMSEIVSEIGWEHAKDAYPEVRQFLQRCGQTVREYDEDFWLRIAMRKVDGAEKLNMPVVFTDVRYPNEYYTLVTCGFLMVRLTRPGTDTPGAQHESETALDGFAADITLTNDRSRVALYRMADHLPHHA